MNLITNDTNQCMQALAALQQVIDPEIGLNIVDLGLIYQIDFDNPGKNIFCRMTLTTQFCPMGESITQAAENALRDRFPDYEIKIHLSFDPPWSHERISMKGLEFLNER